MSLILDNLYLAGVNIAKDIKFIKEKGIKYILVAAGSLAKPFPNVVTYMQINISDNPGTLIIKHFVDCIEFIYNSHQKAPTLVHCLGGVSRSVTIVSAYIMFYKNIDSTQALNFVKSKHNKSYPNPGFIAQLKTFEKAIQIYGKPKKPNFDELRQIMIDINNVDQAQLVIQKLEIKNQHDEEDNNQQFIQ